MFSHCLKRLVCVGYILALNLSLLFLMRVLGIFTYRVVCVVYKKTCRNIIISITLYFYGPYHFFCRGL